MSDDCRELQVAGAWEPALREDDTVPALPKFQIVAARQRREERLFRFFMSSNVEAFISEYHRVGNQLLTIRKARGALCGTAIHFSLRICIFFC
jgi:hypothetical protein